MAKPLRIAVQMDALETINVAGDSSFALMLEAQARGQDRKSTRLNSSHDLASRMPSSA